jgi:hypothetical protein
MNGIILRGSISVLSGAHRNGDFSQDCQVAALVCLAGETVVAILFTQVPVKSLFVGTRSLDRICCRQRVRTYKAEPTVGFLLEKATNDAITMHGCRQFTARLKPCPSFDSLPQPLKVVKASCANWPTEVSDLDKSG